MSPGPQPISAVAPISDIVREEIIALLAPPQNPVPSGDDARLSMDLVEIAQESSEEEDDGGGIPDRQAESA